MVPGAMAVAVSVSMTCCTTQVTRPLTMSLSLWVSVPETSSGTSPVSPSGSSPLLSSPSAVPSSEVGVVGSVPSGSVTSRSTSTLWPTLSVTGTRTTSTPALLFRVVLPKSSVKRKYPSSAVRTLLTPPMMLTVRSPLKVAVTLNWGCPITTDPSERKPTA